ncbi:Vacuolar protein sorting-associated protein 11 [Umbelopsis sp. WA50703]
MAHVQWRQFAFFDRSSVTDSSDPSKTPEAFQSSNTTVFTSGRGHIILADSSGFVHLIDREFNSKSFLAYDGGRVTHLKHLKQSNIIITVGESDQSNQPPVIKFWDFEKIDLTKNIDGGILAPPCTRTIKIQQGGMVHPVSTFAVLENLTQIAVGLANGTVILIRGDLQKERSTKQKVIHEGSEPITGLGFREQTKSTILFMVTTSSIMTYNTTASKPTTTTLDDQGCGLECAVMNDNQDMILGRDEAIYQYDNTGRGPCFAYESPKTSLKWFKSTYLIITSPPLSSTVPSYRPGSSGTANINFTRQPGQQTSSSDLTKLTIFDTANKFVAYKDSFVGGIRGVVCEWGAIWIFGLDNKIYRLDEKDTPSKLEILFKQNLYVLAINLAHMQNYDDASIVEIFKKYGDHLYVKGDYDGAMEQYIRTIGKLEPSYVIRKFLDAQRIYNLTSYLQELHSRGLANADHTTLLLNCYTKLKDVSRLDEFIKNDADLTFDLETAITVCRQAGYFEHAVYLAERFEEHDLYLNIMLLDMHNYQAALAYIAKLGPSEADKNLQKYSKILLKHMPQQTTRILIRLCTGTLPPASSTSPPPLPLRPTSPTSSIVNNTTSALQALSLLPFSGGGTVEDSASAKTQVVTAGGKKSDKIAKHAFQSYAPPSAQIYMPSFVDHPDYLIQFLEEVYEKRTASAREKIMVSESASVKSYPAKEEIPPELSPQDAEEQKVLWTALLELYLMDERPINTSLDDSEDSEIQPSSADESSKQMDKEIARRRILRSKALALLKDKSVDYDANQALVLCHLKQFDDGVVYLYEKMEMYSDIIRFWMEKEETDKVIECARKFGPTDPSLYPLVLTYFSSSPETLEKSTSELLSVLDHIDAQDLLPPLQVVKALSRNDVASLALIKNYMGRKIEKERKDMERDSALIKSYREETERRREEIEDLQTSARVFQVTKCSSCGGMLELPTVHFLCRHSYHQRCLTENDKECPQCAVQHRMIAEMRRTQEANADKHDLFYAQLEDAEDGFSVIADYFSKNTMAFAKLID